MNNKKSVNNYNNQPVTATTSAEPDTTTATPVTSAVVSTIRPGISDALLHRAGVCHIDANTAKARTGNAYPGLWIPYRHLDGTDIIHDRKPFGRIRMDRVVGKQKYHQAYASPARAYLPPGLTDFPVGTPLHLIEGEFKAMALVEAGFLAVGLGGIYGYAREKSTVLVEDVKAVLDHFKPEEVLFVGDSDMVTNYQFSDASIKLFNLLNKTNS